jgi:hypothetical protein
MAQYRLDNGPLVDTGDAALDEEELAALQTDWENIADEEEFGETIGRLYGYSIVQPTARPEPETQSHVIVPVEEFDRLRKAAGEL